MTDAAAVSVNVHVFLLLPPLEHAPDQMASRPLVTDSVIDVPLANDADPVLPTFTLMPDGAVVMRAKTKSVMALAGLLRKKGRKPVAIARLSR